MIVGAGKLGYKLAESMVLEDIDVTVVDYNPKVIDFVKRTLRCPNCFRKWNIINILKRIGHKTI